MYGLRNNIVKESVTDKYPRGAIALNKEHVFEWFHDEGTRKMDFKIEDIVTYLEREKVTDFNVDNVEELLESRPKLSYFFINITRRENVLLMNICDKIVVGVNTKNVMIMV